MRSTDGIQSMENGERWCEEVEGKSYSSRSSSLTKQEISTVDMSKEMEYWNRRFLPNQIRFL
ncbi:hypothetical protein PAMP_014182 [Pampus punctatissimus]